MRKKFNSLKARAKKRNLPVTISLAEYCYHKMGDCYYCGISNLFLEFYCEVMGIGTPWMTIDRKNNDLGYIRDNIVGSCFLCNKIKGSFFTAEEMKKIGEQFVAPKFKLFEEEAMDAYSEWCEYNVTTWEDEEFLDEIATSCA